MSKPNKSDQVIRTPFIKQGWLRVVLFGISFIPLTLLILTPALLILVSVNHIDWKAQPASGLTNLILGNYLWLAVLLEAIIVGINIWLFRKFVDRKSLTSLGLGLSGYETEAITGFLMGPALLGIAALALLLSGHLQWQDINFDPTSLTISLGMLILVAFSEELIFRGYILSNLMDTFANKWVALAISSGLFAILHLTNHGMNSLAFVNLILAGMLLGVNYIFTKNLWFSFTFHLSWNFFQGPLLGFHVSGLSMPSLLLMETKGDAMITGGDFGLEGSIVNTAVSVAAILILGWAFEKKYSR